MVYDSNGPMLLHLLLLLWLLHSLLLVLLLWSLRRLSLLLVLIHLRLVLSVAACLREEGRFYTEPPLRPRWVGIDSKEPWATRLPRDEAGYNRGRLQVCAVSP